MEETNGTQAIADQAEERAEFAAALKKEENKIKRLLKNCDDDLPKNYSKLINNIAWQAVSLVKIRAEVEKNGYIETYDNGGGQSGTKDSSALRAYNNLAKVYLSSCKQLNDIVKPYLINTDNDSKDALAQFLIGGKK